MIEPYAASGRMADGVQGGSRNAVARARLRSVDAILLDCFCFVL
jgi:hypothetical protein